MKSISVCMRNSSVSQWRVFVIKRQEIEIEILCRAQKAARRRKGNTNEKAMALLFLIVTLNFCINVKRHSVNLKNACKLYRTHSEAKGHLY